MVYPKCFKIEGEFFMRRIIALGLLAFLFVGCAGGDPASSATTTDQATSAPTQVQYPPKTKDDLMGLAAQGDASVIHEFHSESVGLTGVCPNQSDL